MASIIGARGDADERDRQIERSGLYGEYPAIVRAYEELFSDPESAGEALKRAVFLVWRSAAGLPWETGLAALPDGTMRAVVDELDARVRRGETDQEQGWMLAWYHTQSPYLLELYGASPAVLRLVDSHSGDTWSGAAIIGASMVRRGQMGRYWSALANGAP